MTGRLDRHITEQRFERLEAQVDALARSVAAIHEAIAIAQGKADAHRSRYTPRPADWR